MGTINYRSNKYITLGLDVDKFKEDYYDELNDYDDLCYNTNFLYDDLNEIIKNYDFNYFTLSLEYGYYDGFYLNIEDKDFLYFENTAEKNETLKETTLLKKLLVELTDCGLVACFPGWCTSFLNEEETKKEIKKAIKQLKEDIKKIPTYKIYKRNGGRF